MKKLFKITLIIIFATCFSVITLSCVEKDPEEKSTAGPKKETPEVYSIFDPTLFYVPPLRLPKEFEVKKAVSVFANGNLKLADGKEIGYVGIVLPKQETSLFGKAKAFISSSVKGKEILIGYDPLIKSQEEGLAYIYCNIPPQLRKAGIEMTAEGKMLNKQLLERGLASVNDTMSFKYRKEFKVYQEKAKAQKKGMWA